MIKFGTSGFRGVIGDNFTKENVQKIGYAICEYLKSENKQNASVVIGYDHRFMSDIYAKWMSEAIASNGVKVYYYSISVPSPLISFMSKKYGLGVMLTASHNPYYYNGVKIFTAPAKEVDEEFCAKIEKWANEDVKVETKSFENLEKENLIEQISNIEDFCESILSFVDTNATKNCNFKILYNSMNGNATECLEYILKKMGIKNYEGMNTNLDPYFRNILPAPYKHNLKDQVKKLVDEKFDFGVALDGDGDRISIITSDGRVLDCNFVLPILYYYFIKVKGYHGGVIKNTALSNLTVKLAKMFGEECYDAKVGFKFIGKLLETTNAFLGGESNGVAFKEHIYSKDGIVVTALLIDMMAKCGKTVDEVLKELQSLTNFPSEVIEYAYPITAEQKAQISNMLFIERRMPTLSKPIVDVVGETEFKILFENDYWATVRFSGTENVARIFAEQENLEMCEKIIKELEAFIGVTTRQA